MNNLIIEDIKWSVVSIKTKFTCGDMPMSSLLKTRKENIPITQMIWITKQPVISKDNVLYNPKALIMIWLN